MVDPKSKAHLPAQFTNDINKLKESVMSMGGVVEQCVSDVIHALAERDNSLLPDSAKAEKIINAYEVQIDYDCVEILARRQPMASDLRMIIATMKISANLERMGDEAEKIVNLAKQTSLDAIPQDIAKIFEHMGKKVLATTSEAMDCFSRLDSTMAQKIVTQDQEIDREYNATLSRLLTYMTQEPNYMLHVINIIWCARSLERIGDHSKNIAEYVIYVDKAVDVRHRQRTS